MPGKYLVLNEHTLGYEIEGTFAGAFGILATSVLRGSNFDRLCGVTVTGAGDSLRPATLADFEFFRVSPKGHIVD